MLGWFTAVLGLTMVRASLLILPVAAAGWFIGLETAGYPKPYWIEWRELDRAAVVGADFVPNEAIYLWVRTESGPRAYRLPWHAEQANRLQVSIREGDPREGRIMVRRPNGEWALEPPDRETPAELKKDDGPGTDATGWPTPR